MSSKYQRKTEKNGWMVEMMERTIRLVNDGMNTREAKHHFHIPKSTICNCIKIGRECKGRLCSKCQQTHSPLSAVVHYSTDESTDFRVLWDIGMLDHHDTSKKKINTAKWSDMLGDTAKKLVISKKALNKSCSVLNSVQKSVGICVYLPQEWR